MVGQNRHRIGADAEVGAHTQVEQPTVTGDQSDRQRQQAEDQVAREPTHQVSADERRDDGQDDDQCEAEQQRHGRHCSPSACARADLPMIPASRVFAMASSAHRRTSAC